MFTHSSAKNAGTTSSCALATDRTLSDRKSCNLPPAQAVRHLLAFFYTLCDWSFENRFLSIWGDEASELVSELDKSATCSVVDCKTLREKQLPIQATVGIGGIGDKHAVTHASVCFSMLGTCSLHLARNPGGSITLQRLSSWRLLTLRADFHEHWPQGREGALHMDLINGHLEVSIVMGYPHSWMVL